MELRCGWRESNNPAGTLALLRSVPFDPASLLAAPADDTFKDDLTAAREFLVGSRSWALGRFERAASEFGSIADRDPVDVFARRMSNEAWIEHAFVLEDAGNDRGAAAVARRIAARDDADAILKLDAARLLIETGRVEEGRAIARPFAERFPWPRAKRLAAAAPTGSSAP